jgi:hypothetical protein
VGDSAQDTLSPLAPFIPTSHDPVCMAVELHLSVARKGDGGGNVRSYTGRVSNTNPYVDERNSFHVTFYETLESTVKDSPKDYWSELAKKHQENRLRVGKLYHPGFGPADTTTKTSWYRQSSFTVPIPPTKFIPYCSLQPMLIFREFFSPVAFG